MKMTLHVDLAAPPEEVWALVGAFGDLAQWHPWVPNCSLSEDGLTRTIHLGPNTAIEVLDPAATTPSSHSYRVEQSPVPVEDYRATWSVQARASGCTVRWSAEFTPTDPNAATFLATFFEQGFDALRDRFGSGD